MLTVGKSSLESSIKGSGVLGWLQHRAASTANFFDKRDNRSSAIRSDWDFVVKSAKDVSAPNVKL